MLEQVLSTAKAPETSGYENKVRQSLPNQVSFAELLRGAGASDKTIKGLEKLAALNVGGAPEERASGKLTVPASLLSTLKGKIGQEALPGSENESPTLAQIIHALTQSPEQGKSALAGEKVSIPAQGVIDSRSASLPSQNASVVAQLKTASQADPGSKDPKRDGEPVADGLEIKGESAMEADTGIMSAPALPRDPSQGLVGQAFSEEGEEPPRGKDNTLNASGADLNQAASEKRKPASEIGEAATEPKRTSDQEKGSALKSAQAEQTSVLKSDARLTMGPGRDETLAGPPSPGIQEGELRAESDLVQASPFDETQESEKTVLTNKTPHDDKSAAESESRQPVSEEVSEELLSQQAVMRVEERREREVFVKELSGQSDGVVRASERVAEMRSDARGGRSGGNAEPPTWSSSVLNGNKTPGTGEQGGGNPGQSGSGQPNQGQASQQQFMQMAQVQAQNQQMLRQQSVDRQVSIQTAQSQGGLEGTADDESLEWLTAGTSSLNADKRPQLPAGLQTIGLPVSHQKWGQALGQRVTYMVNNQIQQAQITLNPEKLGPVQIKLHVDRDQQVHVVMSAQQGVTREAMEAAMPRLREMLEQSGVDMASVDVTDQQAFSDDSGEGEDPEQARALSENGAVKDATESSEERDAQTYTTDNLVDYYA